MWVHVLGEWAVEGGGLYEGAQGFEDYQGDEAVDGAVDQCVAAGCWAAVVLLVND